MKTIGLLLARMGSSRLPGKSLADVSGRPLIARIIGRMLDSDLFDDVVLASPDGDEDRPLLDAGRDAGAVPFAGSEHDVLDRLYQAARSVDADVVVHIGGDCPFPDHALMRRALDLLSDRKADFVSNIERLTYPAGLDTDAMTFAGLERMWKRATLKTHRTHCLSYIHHFPSQFVTASFECNERLGHLRWTVDYPQDLELVRRVYEALGPAGEYFGMDDILDFLRANPDVSRLNEGLSVFVEDQPAYWDSEGYMQDFRADTEGVLRTALTEDATGRHGSAAEHYALASSFIDELARRASSLRDRGASSQISASSHETVPARIDESGIHKP